MSTTELPRLSRSRPCVPAAAPVRIVHLRGTGAPVKDVDADRFVAAATSGHLDAGVQAMLSLFDAEVGRASDLVAAVRAQANAVNSPKG